jgi:hypothetical protein
MQHYPLPWRYELREFYNDVNKLEKAWDIISAPDGTILPSGKPLLGRFICSLKEEDTAKFIVFATNATETLAAL